MAHSALSTMIGPPVQIAYVVGDAHRAAVEWAERFGAGPFFVRPHIEVNDVIYRGTAAEFDHTSAYGQWGSVMVELVQDHGTAPSIVRERFAPNETGLHHHAHFVDDLDASIRALERLGYPLAMSARSTTTRFHFIDTLGPFGHFIELYQPTEQLLGFYRKVREASLNWDGGNPVRQL